MKMDLLELQCCVCNQDYSEDLTPRNLPCGHCVCSSCTEILIPENKKCPECRSPFTVNKASDLPVNHPLLRMSRLISFGKGDASETPQLKFPLKFPSSRFVLHDAGKCPKHGLSMFFMCLRCVVPVCRDCLVKDHVDPPFGRCLVLYLDAAVDNIKKSFGRATESYIEKAQATLIRLKGEEKKLNMAATALQSLGNLNDSENITEDLQELQMVKEDVLSRHLVIEHALSSVEHFHGKLKDVTSSENIRTLMTDVINSQEDLDKFIREDDEKRSSFLLETIFDKILDLQKLLRCEIPLYAVKEEEDYMWAPLKSKSGKIHLFALRCGPPPDGGLSIPYQLIRDRVPVDSPLVFFEVTSSGTPKGTVYVRMFSDTPRSRQTVLLCSGEKGPSYRGTCFYNAARYRNGCYLISGGDYENNDGTGGRAIVRGIVSGEPYYHEVKAGLFVSWPSHEHWHLGAFDIYLKDTPGIHDHSAHGIVQQGLDILTEAATLKPINQTSVEECGVIVSI